MKKTLRFLKRFSLWLIAISIGLVSFIYIANRSVSNSSKGKLYSSAKSIPKNDVGLLLGTAKYLWNGRLNLYYKYRIDGAVQLYKSGKIKYILISGDNGRKTYDEPSTMKADLVKKGIPANRIFLDYAGFRTLDSVVRAKEVFGQSKLTIISQKFHNERAIYLANNKGIEAIGFNVRGVSKRYGRTVMMREKLARSKAMLDILINKQPKFLGKKIKIS